MDEYKDMLVASENLSEIKQPTKGEEIKKLMEDCMQTLADNPPTDNVAIKAIETLLQVITAYQENAMRSFEEMKYLSSIVDAQKKTIQTIWQLKPDIVNKVLSKNNLR